MTARICVVTSGHLSTCPRMLKAADALADAGHAVRVVSTRYIDWAMRADAEVRERRRGRWTWTPVDYSPATGRRTRLESGLRRKAFHALARALGAGRCPPAVAARASSRVHGELVRAALAEPADLFYGGTSGALAATADAAARRGVPCALDLEDFHTAEQEDGPAARIAHALVGRVERAVLPRAAFLTAASAAIARAYTEAYDVAPIVVHNTFPLPPVPPDLGPGDSPGLRCYWFSQTIGPGRGLEDALRAMGRADLPGEIHLRGRAGDGYVDRLRALAGEAAPRVRLVHHDPVAPDLVPASCAGYDVGLSLEQDRVKNRALCLTNKACTYVLAGLPVALTRTPGHEAFAADLGPGALVCRPGDVDALAAGFTRWARDRRLHGQAKVASWRAAERRWHWEHPAERGALLDAVARTLARSNP